MNGLVNGWRISHTFIRKYLNQILYFCRLYRSPVRIMATVGQYFCYTKIWNGTEKRETVKYWLTFLPGRSEKSRMHSLKPLANRRSLSCCSMATPIQKGNEELPSSNVSHRWKILCRGNTSACQVEKQIQQGKCVTNTISVSGFFFFNFFLMRFSCSCAI